MSEPIITYLADLARYHADPHSSEMSYRTAFQNYLTSIFPQAEKYHIQHDPKAIKGNKPDFIVLKHGVPLLYIEVKKLGEDLDKIERSSQVARYFGYTNLIISDYAEFRFFRNGERYGDPIKLAEVDAKAGIITPAPHKADMLVRTIVEFVESRKEPIQSGKHLAKIMGGKAQRIRENIIAFLDTESAEKDEIVRMMRYIKDTLITQLTREDFADMYAQTLVYGLFAARYHDPSLETFTRAEALDLVPATNPFLKQFFGHIAGPSFPTRLRYIVDELCEVFVHADVRTLMQEYFKQSTLFGEEEVESPDPVIHFYEDFLREYDPGKKAEMGVFYTPLPVVRFIVRGVDEIMKGTFGIERGLGDTSKVTLAREVPGKGGAMRRVKEDIHRVQILDVATGTGTFLNEIVKHIRASLGNNAGRWHSYVEQDLLPRLHGFELMMASYTIAHLKLGMTLEEEGEHTRTLTRRLGVYLTNTLDEPHDVPLQSSLFGVVESIAEESKLASRVKKEYPILVLIGNPPYSGESMNPHYTAHDVYKVEPGGKEKLKEKNSKWLNDDYVKFIRFTESMVEKNGEGVVGMITAHGYLDNPTFRGMRWHLRETFDDIYVLDLHGNANKKETAPDGSKDENVFDIKTGVAIIFGVKTRTAGARKKPATVHHAELYGTRKEKFTALSGVSLETLRWRTLPANADVWRVEGKGKAEYMQGFSVAELFPTKSVGVVTARDAMSIQFERGNIERVVSDFHELDCETLRTKYSLGKDVRDWSVVGAKEDVGRDDGSIMQIAYRPFDVRWTYYTGRSKGFHCMPRGEVMKHFVAGENVGLVFARTQKNPEWNAVFISSAMTETKLGEASTQSAVAPLYLYTDSGEKVPNLAPELVAGIEETAGKTTPEDILDYVYAYLHAPSYRKKYGEFLKVDFPRVPYPASKTQFWQLVSLGTTLRGLHLLTDPAVSRSPVSFPISGTNVVEKVVLDGTRVYINATQYFEGVPKDVWSFYIGGYQPAQKYLKDRKGRTLTNAEFEQYEKIIASLSRTMEIMTEVDAVLVGR